MNGLAQMGQAPTQPQAQQPQQPDQAQIEELLRKVIELLSQGVPPEELVKAGVPEEIIQQAMQIMQQQGMAPGQAQQAPLIQ